MARDYNRYELVKNGDGTMNQLPYIIIPQAPSDKYIEWVEGRSRLDLISQKYYGSPYYDWVIVWANPEFISEFDIPDGAIIKIPFPLGRVLSAYEEGIKRFNEL